MEMKNIYTNYELRELSRLCGSTVGVIAQIAREMLYTGVLDDDLLRLRNEN